MSIRWAFLQGCTFATFEEVRAAAALHPADVIVTLDGVLTGPSRTTPDRTSWNFDHHTDVCRNCTPSTAAQVLEAVTLGTVQAGSDLHDRCVVAFNDVDPDVVFALWALENAEQIASAWGSERQRLDAIFAAQDLIDRSYGLQRLPGTVDMALRWIVEPWQIRTPMSQPTGCIPEMFHRLTEFVATGVYEPLTEMPSPELVSLTPPVALLHEFGICDRSILHQFDGLHEARVFVARRYTKDGPTRQVSIGLLDFPATGHLDALWEELNRREPDPVDGLQAGDRWGGSPVIGGSPRRNGTSLTDLQIIDTVHDHLEQHPPEPHRCDAGHRPHGVR